MKYFLVLVCFIFSIITCLASCDSNGSAGSGSLNRESKSTISKTMDSTIKVKIGSRTFTVMLYDNATADAFKSMLPLTLTMEELNGNEKHADVNSKLPLDVANPGTIQSGDLMIWSSNTLVLFYKSFPTHYSYTKLGRIVDTNGLADAVGSGSITVTFSLQ